MVVQEVASGSLTYQAFQERFELPGVPVVIRGEASAWPCTSKWSIAWLRDRFADKVIRLPGKAPIEVGRHLDQVLASTTDAGPSEAPAYLLKNIWLRDHFSELVVDVRVPDMVKDNWLEKFPVRVACDRRWQDWMEFFVCGVGVRYPVIHQDVLGTHGWLAQIAGRKRYWLWPPHAVPGRGAISPDDKGIVGFGRNGWNRVDGETDLSAAFPGHSPALASLAPGDVIFIPSRWWHTMETLEPAINLGGNWFNSSNWQSVQEDALKRSDTPRLFRSRTYLRALDVLYG